MSELLSRAKDAIETLKTARYDCLIAAKRFSDAKTIYQRIESETVLDNQLAKNQEIRQAFVIEALDDAGALAEYEITKADFEADKLNVQACIAELEALTTLAMIESYGTTD